MIKTESGLPSHLFGERDVLPYHQHPPPLTSHITYNMVSQEDCPLLGVWVTEKKKGKFYDESGSVS